jgi:tripartite-type tricarboxylate transporter receptor subunit TctC
VRRGAPAAALACVIFAGSTGAQEFPAHSIRIVVPFAAGGGADLAGRVVGQKLSEALGQAVAVEDRPGANGSIGAEAVARAAPDGTMLAMGSNANITTNPHLYPLSFDPMRDLVPVAMLSVNPLLLFVNPALIPVASVGELVAFARAQPHPIDYASAGTGSPGHLAMELLKMSAGVSMVHVPYKGGTPGVNDVLGGRIGVMFAAAPAVLPYLRAQRLRGLATSGAARSVFAPDLPTIAEAGFAGFDVVIWNALFAPARTPEDTVRRLNTEINRILAQPDTRSILISQGAEPQPMERSQLTKFVREDYERWGRVIRAAGIHAD